MVVQWCSGLGDKLSCMHVRVLGCDLERVVVILFAWGRRVVDVGKYRISGVFFFCVCAVGDGGGRCAIGFDCACDHVVVCE